MKSVTEEVRIKMEISSEECNEINLIADNYIIYKEIYMEIDDNINMMRVIIKDMIYEDIYDEIDEQIVMRQIRQIRQIRKDVYDEINN